MGTTSYEGLRGLHLSAASLVALPRIGTDDSLLLECYGNGMLEVGYMTNPYSAFEPVHTRQETQHAASPHS